VMEQWENNNFKHPTNLIAQYIFTLCIKVFVRSVDG